ncbi:MAG: hypothetical protein FWG08_05920 [Propionibacteriaceae bacterium]|jgi:hypothetical protein|nr:hypothetical protein [Propionibacteriaceae bacterium]
MSLRISQAPWGIARLAYSYLAAIVAGLSASALLLVVWPLAGVLPLCHGEVSCQQVLTAYCGAGLLVAGLFVVAVIFRLGWQWAAWMVVFTLVVAQCLIDFEILSLGWVFFAIPALAAVATWGRLDDPPPRWLRILRVSVLGVLAIQFIIWLVILLTS